mmetsp:Transcript_16884/g.41862  ORF Transcript_16884/g.41862 Transcript_16884/m.41862 type:complete len:206 (-) Transcript_16884:1698-2315(-)
MPSMGRIAGRAVSAHHLQPGPELAGVSVHAPSARQHSSVYHTGEDHDRRDPPAAEAGHRQQQHLLLLLHPKHTFFVKLYTNTYSPFYAPHCHSMTDLSLPQLANIFPAGSNLTSCALSSWPSRFFTNTLASRSNIFTAPSPDARARVLPLPSKSAAFTGWGPASICRNSHTILMSQSLQSPSASQETSAVPARWNRQEFTALECP